MENNAEKSQANSPSHASTTSHTPGPWQTGAMSVSVSDKNYANVAVCGGKYRSTAEKIANARLIAAAPDMLAALGGAVVIIETCGWPDAASPALRAEFDKRRAAIIAAIAKAEGRS